VEERIARHRQTSRGAVRFVGMWHTHPYALPFPSPTDQQAVLHTTVLANTPCSAVIAGSAGTLVLPGPFYQPGAFEVRFVDGRRWVHDEPAVSHQGLFWQAAEVARCIAEGRTESPVRPLADSVTTLSAMDEARRQVGIRFPGEA